MLASPSQELTWKPRQVVEVDIEKTQTSCGYAVPVMTFVRERREIDRGHGYKDPKYCKQRMKKD